MGLFLSRLSEAFFKFGDTPARILMLGLDAAGKTTILYKIKLNETVTTIPTVGFNVETVQPRRGLTFTVWDVGGQEVIRKLWRHYYQNTEGLIYVVDSADRLRMQEARDELFGILESDEIDPGLPFVVIANKQDLPGACSTAEVVEALNLRKLTRNPWRVQGAISITGEGIFEAISDLADMVKDFKKSKRR